MTPPKPNSDITVRGALINVPDLRSPTHPPRHQPDTPPNKKRAPVKSDHQPATTKPEPVVEKTEPVKKSEPTDQVPEELE